MINVLLTSAGRRSYIVDYFKQCEGVGRVYASNSEYSVALQRADGYFISPLIYADNYVDSLISFCKQKDIKIVLSLFDIDLLVLARNRAAFESNGIRVVLASPEFVSTCNDKWQTYLFIKHLGLQTPKTYLTKDDLRNAIAQGEVSYPIIMKPRWGMASMGIYKVENDQELDVFTDKCCRDIFGSYLKYETASTQSDPIIYQEIMTGEEYGLDVINDLNGNHITTFAKQKVTMRSGETDLGRTADSAPFAYVGETIANASKHEGICSVDCFRNDDGIFVIEMNCRISGHYPLAHLAGVNYPQLVIDWLAGKATNVKYLQFKPNLFIVKDLQPTILSTMGGG